MSSDQDSGGVISSLSSNARYIEKSVSGSKFVIILSNGSINSNTSFIQEIYGCNSRRREAMFPCPPQPLVWAAAAGHRDKEKMNSEDMQV